ncbi:MAG: response regulator transcription factor [Caldilineaceae bacterium]|nr:response regulator transcription factor [Caldilineaceae bacterium]
MIQLLLVYPTRMTCELIAAALQGEEDINVVGYAHNGDEALSKLSKCQCDTVLVSIDLPSNEAFKFARAVRQSSKEMKILMAGLVRSNAAILRCVEEGLSGYVLDDDSLADLVKKLRAVHEEEFIVSPAMASALMDRVAELKQMIKEFHSTSLNWSEDLFAELTPREWEVLQLIEEGCDNQQIADRLVIEKGTVKNHVHNILGKLDVRSREQAALLARQLFAHPVEGKADPDLVQRFPNIESIGTSFRSRTSPLHA